jgi:hypothetical protein
VIPVQNNYREFQQIGSSQSQGSSMIKRITLTAVVLAAYVLLPASAKAQTDVIRGATVIRNDLGASNPSGGGPARLFQQDDLFDSNGLPTGYVSGATLFDIFDPANVVNGASSNAWFSQNLASPGFTDFDLGVSSTVTRLAFWDAPIDFFGDPNDNSTGDFNVYVSDDSSFTGAAIAGSFSLVNNGLSSGAPGQVFDIADTLGQYVRIEHLTTQGGTFFGAGELAFATTDPVAIPEPGIVGLLGLVGLGIGFRRKKRPTVLS